TRSAKADERFARASRLNRRRGTFMTKMASFQVFAMVGALAVASPSAAVGQETERIDRTASMRAGGELRVKNFSGKVTITGSRRGDVAIHAIRRASRERLDNIKLEVTETGSGVT